MPSTFCLSAAMSRKLRTPGKSKPSRPRCSASLQTFIGVASVAGFSSAGLTCARASWVLVSSKAFVSLSMFSVALSACASKDSRIVLSPTCCSTKLLRSVRALSMVLLASRTAAVRRLISLLNGSLLSRACLSSNKSLTALALLFLSAFCSSVFTCLSSVCFWSSLSPVIFSRMSLSNFKRGGMLCKAVSSSTTLRTAGAYHVGSPRSLAAPSSRGAAFCLALLSASSAF